MKRTLSVLLLAVLLSPGGALRAQEAGGLGGAELEMQRSRTLLDELTEEVRLLQAMGYSFNPNERLVDASVYMDLGHHEQAAMLLTSLVDNEAFKRSNDYHEALRMLGVAFFHTRSYLAARRQFALLQEVGSFRESAIIYLVEIDARLGRSGELAKTAASISDVGATDGMLYAKGKALYHAGQFEKVASTMGLINSDQRLRSKGQYVAGASLVALGRLDDARRTFESLLAQPAQDPEEVELQGLATLSLGRIALEAGDFAAAADFYQRVPQESSYFERSLFEVTHVYLRWAGEREDPAERFRSYSRAEELLDVLVAMTLDPELLRDARVLRGRIAMYLDKFDVAEESYREVIERFASISSEMTDMAQNPETIDRFFDGMIRGGDRDGELNLFVSQEVIDWMRVQPGLGRVVEMLTDVADQRAVLAEAKKVFDQLKYSLSQDNARELFPGFADAWLKSKEVENRLMMADEFLIQAETAAAGNRLSESARTELARIAERKDTLRTQLETAPKTVGGYKARNQQLLLRIQEMLKEADEQVARIGQMREQVLAMQQILKEIKYKGSKLIEIKGEQDFTKDLVAEGERLTALLRDAESTRADIEKESLVADMGDPRGKSEQDLKDQLWAEQRKEAALFIEASKDLDGEALATIEKANAVRRDLIRMVEMVRQQQLELDRKAKIQIEQFKKALAIEEKELAARFAEFDATEKAAGSFAQAAGSAMFIEAKEELVRAVVEADLGLVDLAWKRKSNESKQIAAIQKDRAAVVKKLREDLRTIAGDEEAE